MADRKVRQSRMAISANEEVRLGYKVQLAQIVGRVIMTGFPWLGACVIAYFGYKCIDVLAGEKTVANIGVRLFADVRISEAVAWLFGSGGVAYGWKQRSLRRMTVERLTGRITDLERKRDSSRSSSRLTSRGETNPKDKL